MCNEICDGHTEETEQTGKLCQVLVSRAPLSVDVYANMKQGTMSESGRNRTTSSRYSDLGVFIIPTSQRPCSHTIEIV